MNQKIRFLLLIALLVCLVSGAMGSIDPYRLTHDIVPLSQKIHLKLDPRKPDYEGEVKIEIDIRKPTSSIRLHAQDMDIGEVILKNGKNVWNPAVEMDSLGFLELGLSGNLSKGRYTLQIRFKNDFNTSGTGLFRFEDDKFSYAATQFEAIYARQALPCWDEPAFKIHYQMILTIPEEFKGFANTPIQKTETADGHTTLTFEASPPMPAHLLACAVGPYETVPIEGMSVPTRVITVKGKTNLTDVAVHYTPIILKTLEDYFGESYPYRKLDLIALTEFGGAMENPGLVTFSEGILLHDKNLISFSDRRSLVRITMHELAHMWYGNKVTLAWWDDLWLNEGFAEWMDTKLTAAAFPEFRYGITTVKRAQQPMTTDALPGTKSVLLSIPGDVDPVEAFDEMAYQKGQSIIHMVESWVGERQFQEAIRDYIKKIAWDNADTKQVLAILSKSTGEDIGQIVSDFTASPGVPLLNVEIIGDNRIRLSQKRFANYKIPHQIKPVWHIPVVLKYSDGSFVYEQKILMDQQSEVVQLEVKAPIQWILPNKDAAGYYRYWMPPKALTSLSEAAATQLSLPERMALIYNLRALLNAGLISTSDYLASLLLFKDDTDPEVIEILVYALYNINGMFIDESNEKSFAPYVNQLLEPARSRFGITKKDGEIPTASVLRPHLMYCLGKFGQDKEMIDKAVRITDQYIKNPDSAEPALVENAFLLTSQQGDRNLFNSYKKHFENVKSPTDRYRYSMALGNFTDPSLINEALEYSLTESVKPNETATIFIRISYEKNNQVRLLNWFMENFEELKKKLPPIYIPFSISYFQISPLSQIEKLRTFVQHPDRTSSFMEKQMQKLYETVQQAENLREKELDNLNRYLSSL